MGETLVRGAPVFFERALVSVPEGPELTAEDSAIEMVSLISLWMMDLSDRVATNNAKTR